MAILPCIIRGTRTVLRSDQWFPRWSAISVEIEGAVAPEGTNFPSVVRLRDTVREAILKHCGEPDLAELVKPEPA